DNNDDTSYVIGQGSNNSGSNVKTVQIEYLPSERVTNTVYEVGAVIPEESSGSIVATKVVTYREEDLKNQGLLNNMTFDEFVNLNSDRKQMEVSDDIYKLVSLATGVPQDQIQIIAYEQPVFIPIESKVFNWDTFLQILLLILIIALLLFIVFKGSKPVEVMETEPEISVEELLASTNEQKLEDIDLSEKSETKRIIEKLVDEDPESVAKLLRNWLNEEEWD
ncbi:MAG: flagellar biosynthesis protein, partial [Clostridiales bacterium]|nr:flagellar biosynthesis protein [Clostridiales bacterium]